MGMRTTLVLSVVTAFALALSGGPATAGMYNLTGSGSNTVQINGAWFYNSNAASTGTGVIDSFVRLQTNNRTEQGYNTSGRPLRYNENNSPQFTRSLSLSTIPVVTINNVQYREFLLDINQSTCSPLLSLDEMKIYVSGSEKLTGNLSSVASHSTQVYNLDGASGDNWVVLDYSLNSGSGSGDMFAYIPSSAFGSGEYYVYLYSKFGVHNSNNGGFEEWAVRKCDMPVVPVPAGLILGVLGLGAAGWKLRRFA